MIRLFRGRYLYTPTIDTSIQAVENGDLVGSMEGLKRRKHHMDPFADITNNNIKHVVNRKKL